MSSPTLWKRCADRLETELSQQQFNTWILPLQADQQGGQIHLLAPNRFVLDWVRDNYLNRIQELLEAFSDGESISVALAIGTRRDLQAEKKAAPRRSNSNAPSAGIAGGSAIPAEQNSQVAAAPAKPAAPPFVSNLNTLFSFDMFVEGKSNELARAAAHQVAENPGGAYNPLFLYGGSGLGKTHLMHAVGNLMLNSNPNARVLYVHSEKFVGDMVKALQHNQMNEFKRHYRSVNALLIDDIQFFAGKERSQEEFFHTFNTLLESQQQIVMTCDRYPKEIEGMEERLKSRLGWGLPVVIEPPDLETRVAILKNKASQASRDLPDEVAFFVAKRIRSNVRELEGALRRVIANSEFTGRPITLDFAKEALSDLLAIQEKQVSIENIQKTVAQYYKIRVADLLSGKRSRSIARPRQVAMSLSKELTNHSLPEIGSAFGGRDHTTVLHAVRKIEELRERDQRINEDYSNLLRTMTS